MLMALLQQTKVDETQESLGLDGSTKALSSDPSTTKKKKK
jgi:hypothetical protein